MKKQSRISVNFQAAYLSGIIFCLLFTMLDTHFHAVVNHSSNSTVRPTLYNPTHFFEKNKGQTDKTVDYIYRDKSCILYLTSSGSIVNLLDNGKNPQSTPMHMELIESNPVAQGRGTGLLNSKSNYFIGNEPDRWISNIPHYAQVEYQDVYSDIDLVYYFNNNQIEFDFIVKPGAKPGDIGLSFSGVDHCKMDEEGNLILSANGHELVYKKPAAWQDLKNGRENVEVAYTVLGNQVRFDLGVYDPEETLIIDPKVVYATYLGGAYYDYAYGIAVDSEGCAYVTGATGSVDFPTQYAFQPERGVLSSQSGMDAFITKFNADGTDIVYSTYIGGWADDVAVAIAVDSQGNAGITGKTASRNRSSTPENDALPLKNAYQPTLGGTTNKWDAFVTVLNVNGSDLVYSTFLGGKYDDEGMDIDVDASGCFYVGGTTFSFDFPNKSAFMENISSYYFEAFASKLDPSKSGETSLIYSTFLGGDLDDYGNSIAVDAQGCAHVTGQAKSTDFPTMNPIQSTKKGPNDAFVTKLSSDGRSLVYSTYLGGDYGDEGRAIDVDDDGHAYFYGLVSSGFTANPSPFDGQSSSLVSKLETDGSGFMYSIYVLGSGRRIAVDESGQVYIAATNNGNAYVFALNAQGTDSLFTFTIGGSDTDSGQDITVGSDGSLYIAGTTKSQDFPVVDAYQSDYGDDVTGFVKSDAFVLKLADVKRNLQVTPNPVIFPLTLPGETSRETVEVSNPSTEDIEIQNIDVEPTTIFALENDPDLPVTLQSEEQIEFQVAYSPGGVGKEAFSLASGTGALTIVNDGDTPFISVPIETEGIVVNDTGDESDYDLKDGVCDADPGLEIKCTFRAAIENVNYLQDENVTTVYIRIPGDGGAEIWPRSPLDPIEYPVYFDTEGPDDPLRLIGFGAGQTDGLEIRSGYCFVQHFIIYNWQGNGIKINGGEQNTIQNCTIYSNGIGPDTPVAGIHIEESSRNRLRNNYIHSNDKYGIFINGELSTHNTIEACTLGYDQGGLPKAQTGTGVYIKDGPDNTIRTSKVGNTSDARIFVNGAARTIIEHNEIVDGKWHGIKLTGSAIETKIRYNHIGCDKTGLFEAPNDNGIRIFDGPTDTHIHDNLISGNTFSGIHVGEEDGTIKPVIGTVIEDNIIGLEVTGNSSLPNQIGILLKGQCQSTTIRENTISGNQKGIYIQNIGKNTTGIYDNYIGTDATGTLPRPNYNTGIYVYNSSSVTIIGNTVSNQRYQQIHLLDVKIGRITIMNNNIGTDKNGSEMTEFDPDRYSTGITCDNSVADISSNLIAYHPRGIRLRNGSRGNIYENFIRHNEIGLRISDSSAEVFMNEIYDNKEGLLIENTEEYDVIVGGCNLFDNTAVNTGIHLNNTNATIIGNNITGDAGHAISIEGSGNPLINKNNILDNDGFGVNHTGIAASINARNNWWGSADGPGNAGPGSGDEVSAGVDFSGWRDEQISLFVSAQNDTNILRIGYVLPVTLLFQNWTTPNDVVNFKIEADQPWIYLYTENTVSLDNEWGGRGQALFGIPAGTPAGTMAHAVVSAVSTTDGSVDSTRFVVVAGSMDLSTVVILPDSVTVFPGDTVRFAAEGYNQFSLSVDIVPQWACTGGSIDTSGQFIAGDETGSFTVTVADAASGLTDQAQVIIIENTYVDEMKNAIPSTFQLPQNYPNPFNPNTRIQYSIPIQTHVTIDIYNILGRKVCTLVDRVHAPGQYIANWDGVDSKNMMVTGGIYIYQIKTVHFQKSRKMLLIR